MLGFDPIALGQRYRHERDRRLRPERSAQYVRVDEKLGQRDRDPYTPWVERDPVDEQVEVLIVGGGWGGLLAGAYLRKAAVQDLRFVEVGGDFGGTWYWNRYPNAQCDTESYIYMPLLEDLGYIPTRNYAYGPELLAHAQAIGRHFDFYRQALFHTELTGAAWDPAIARWRVTTDRGDRMRARHVIFAHGAMTQPKLPDIHGIDRFRGHVFHTARWDYGYTGGDYHGGLVGLADKRVAVVGTGATAVQCVVPVAECAKELSVFQRTPSAIGVRNNRLTDETWVAGLTPGWQRRRSDAFAAAIEGNVVDEVFPGDGWIPLMSAHRRVLSNLRAAGYKLKPGESGHVGENVDYLLMNEIRARIDAVVRDPQKAEILKPWYRPLCKRPCFHDEYLDTFNRPNVRLIDAGNGGVRCLTEHGVQVGGTVYEADCVIFATGYEFGQNFAARAGFDIIGRDGVKLADKWAQFCRTQFGTTTAGFPNCYFMTATQTPLPQNVTTLFEELAEHIAYLIGEAKRRGALTIESTAAGEQMWQEEVLSKQRDSERFYRNCTPGYFNNEGDPAGKSWFGTLYGGGTVRYFEIVRGWRSRGDLEGMQLQHDVNAGQGLATTP